MSRTNDAIADADKAVDAHKRNQNRPEGADHLPLKDDKDYSDDSSDTDGGDGD